MPNKPFAFYGQNEYVAAFDQQNGCHAFGNLEPNLEIENLERGNLHQLIWLDLSDPVLGIQYNCKLPLLYCFNFDSGFLEYHWLDDGGILLKTLNTGSFDPDEPYFDYPSSFPVQRFAFEKPKSSTFEEFSEKVWQGIPVDEKRKLIVVVPPSDLYGVHLWDEESNHDDVHIKFFIDVEDRFVRVYNECG